MSPEPLQFNSSSNIVGGKNVTEAVSVNEDIYFNESYIVIGELLEGKCIYASYDLQVLGDLRADKITVNGSLTVSGNVQAGSILCHGEFICSGNVKAENIEIENFTLANTLTCDKLFSSGDVFVQNTIDSDSIFKSEGLVIAGEGIIGNGSFEAKTTIANEYFEFLGEHSNRLLEIEEIDFDRLKTHESTTKFTDETEILKNIDFENALKTFINTFNRDIHNWAQLEERDFVDLLRKIAKELPDLHSVDRIIDHVIDLSYEQEIANFRDYLYVLFAREVFPIELIQYETLEPVLNTYFETATSKLSLLEFKANDLEDFAFSIYILSLFYKDLPISLKESADKIFSSIGLRYSTVEYAWRTYNG